MAISLIGMGSCKILSRLGKDWNIVLFKNKKLGIEIFLSHLQKCDRIGIDKYRLMSSHCQLCWFSYYYIIKLLNILTWLKSVTIQIYSFLSIGPNINVQWKQIGN